MDLKRRILFWALFLTLSTVGVFIVYSEQIFQLYEIKTGKNLNSGPSYMDDQDHDGIVTPEDNCYATPNPDQKDENRNNVGDACEFCFLDQTDYNGDNLRLSYIEFQDQAKRGGFPTFNPFSWCFPENDHDKIFPIKECVKTLAEEQKKDDFDQDKIPDSCDRDLILLKHREPIIHEIREHGMIVNRFNIFLSKQENSLKYIETATNLEREYGLHLLECAKYYMEVKCIAEAPNVQNFMTAKQLLIKLSNDPRISSNFLETDLSLIKHIKPTPF